MEFTKLKLEVNIEPLKAALEESDLWNRYPFRKHGYHREMVDIWARYNDLQPFLKKGDMTGVNDEHDSIWYPSPLIPFIKPIAYAIMSEVNGERLGGVLITKLPPYGKIHRHVDSGWHATYYAKYYVCVKDGGSQFQFDSGTIHPKEGEIWWFDNQKPHEVINNDKERIAMIVCIKSDGGGPCHSESH